MDSSFHEHDIEREIIQVLERSVMDYVRSHGGHLVYCGFSHGTVRVRMSGTCSACSARNITLRFGVERMLRKECKAVDRVELID